MINIEKFPKSKEKLLGFIKGHLEVFQKSLMKDEKELPPIDPGIVEATMDNILDNNPRSLYNFFDKEKVYVLVDLDENAWSFRVVSKNTFSSGKFSAREHAETEGFKEALKILENG